MQRVQGIRSRVIQQVGFEVLDALAERLEHRKGMIDHRIQQGMRQSVGARAARLAGGCGRPWPSCRMAWASYSRACTMVCDAAVDGRSSSGALPGGAYCL
ncbi:MAG: hypothetical protein Kow0073_08120 [Immundisolibacter sp.]